MPGDDVSSPLSRVLSKRRTALVPLFLAFAPLAWADDVTDGLLANRAALAAAEGKVEIRTTETVDGKTSRTSVATPEWALREGDYVVSSPRPGGLSPVRSLTREGRHYIYSAETMFSPEGERQAYHVTHLANSDAPPDALQFGLRPNGEWYADLAQKGGLRVVDRSQPDLVEVAGRFPRSGAFRAWLKPSAGYLAIRARFENPEVGTSSEYVVGRWSRQNGAVVPLEGTLIDHEPYEGGTTLRSEMRTTFLRVGPVEEARVELPPMTQGTTIKDDVAGRFYTIGPNGERLNAGAVGHASPPSPNVVRYGWFFVLACGSLLVASGVSIKRSVVRRRTKPA